LGIFSVFAMPRSLERGSFSSSSIFMFCLFCWNVVFECKLPQCPVWQAGGVPYFICEEVGCSVKFMSRATRAGWSCPANGLHNLKIVNQRGNCMYYSTFGRAVQEIHYFSNRTFRFESRVRCVCFACLTTKLSSNLFTFMNGTVWVICVL
jgi:hypothetical protein